MTTMASPDATKSTPIDVPRIFAIIPAAGLSRRMGQAKLLLPWGATTMLGQLLDTLNIEPIVCRLVITRAADTVLQAEIARHDALAISPEVDPPDMRASVEFGLHTIAERYQPQSADGWLMLPGDCPLITRSTLQQLLQVWLATRPRFLVPTHQGKRGHPLIARWDTAQDVGRLASDVGLNHLLRQAGSAVVEWPVNDPGVLTDLDTPEEYRDAVRIHATQTTKAAED